MATKESGTKCSDESPEAPAEVVDAASADPGKIAKAKAKESKGKSDKYDSVKLEKKDKKDTDDEEQEKTHWITIKLEDHEGKPAGGARYKVKLPDGSVQTGYLAKDGKKEFKPIPEGECKISFPDIHEDEWSLKG